MNNKNEIYEYLNIKINNKSHTEMTVEELIALPKQLTPEYKSLDDFIKYSTFLSSEPKFEHYYLGNVEDLCAKSEQDFTINKTTYIPNKIKKFEQDGNTIKMLISTTGMKVDDGSETGGAPDFKLVFNIENNQTLDIPKDPIIHYFGYTDNKFVLLTENNGIKEVLSASISDPILIKQKKKIISNDDNLVKKPRI